MTDVVRALFLTPDQLREMTGYVQPAAQIRWLRKFGVRHWVRVDGRPTVPMSALDGERVPAPRPGPKYDAARREG